MKIIFLDIDGVLNTNASIKNGVQIIPEKVCLLNKIAMDTGAKIVISSTWRMAFPFQFIRDFLKFTGLKAPHVVVGKTPHGHNFANRGEEIDSVLMADSRITKYVILDDLDPKNFSEEQRVHLVSIDPQLGLTAHHVNSVVCKLNS